MKTQKEKLVEELESIYISTLPYNLLDKIADFIIKDRESILESFKYKPHSHRIPCPDGNLGCLVIHYSSDLILTPEERSFNDRIDRMIKGVQNDS